MLYPIWGVNDDGVCTCPKGADCGSPGKHPMTRHGIKDASSDPFQIAAMFSAHPECNSGLATGRASGVVVLDQDAYAGGWASMEQLQKEHGKLPSTRLHQTGEPICTTTTRSRRGWSGCRAEPSPQAWNSRRMAREWCCPHLAAIGASTAS